MGLSWSHILIAMLAFALLFGRGRISGLMGDLAEGIKSFKKGLTENEAKPEPKIIDNQDLPALAKSVRSRKFGRKASKSSPSANRTVAQR
jgi:sec-independent protein translocase protein TatA